MEDFLRSPQEEISREIGYFQSRIANIKEKMSEIVS